MTIFWQVFLVIYFLGLFYSAYQILYKQTHRWTWRFSLMMFFTWLFWPVAVPLVFYVDDRLNR